MKIIKGITAYENLLIGIKTKKFRYPTKNEVKFSNGYLLPEPNLYLDLFTHGKIFTIGSCFAREIELRLIQKKMNVPAAKFTLPAGEFPHPSPHILNEYNAGTIFQRVNSALGIFNYSKDAGIEEIDGGFIDLFLHIHQKPVSLDRLLERRIEISDLYQNLTDSDVAVITLGLVEAWYDNLHQCYLNKAPSKKTVRDHLNRYEFHRMDVDDILRYTYPSVEGILSNQKTKILLTVSPVPIEATFTGNDAIIANYYSKSALRVASQILSENFERLIYFPSYEIAMSNGSNSFTDDNVHVQAETVNTIMKALLEDPKINTIGSEEKNYIDVEAIDRLGKLI